MVDGLPVDSYFTGQGAREVDPPADEREKRGLARPRRSHAGIDVPPLERSRDLVENHWVLCLMESEAHFLKGEGEGGGDLAEGKVGTISNNRGGKGQSL